MSQPENQPITNVIRAQCAADVINAMPNGDADDDMKCSVVDLLANIRHYCDQHGLEFHDLDRAAYRHYLAERRGAA